MATTEEIRDVAGTADREDALAAVSEAAELWGGRCERRGGEAVVTLPVQAGVRHGELRGRVRFRRIGDGGQLALAVDGVDYRVHRQATALLVVGTLACVVTVAWPFWPALSGLVPMALILAVATWFLIVTRLENRGPAEFLATVEDLLGDEDEVPPRDSERHDDTRSAARESVDRR